MKLERLFTGRHAFAYLDCPTCISNTLHRARKCLSCGTEQQTFYFLETHPLLVRNSAEQMDYYRERASQSRKLLLSSRRHGSPQIPWPSKRAQAMKIAQAAIAKMMGKK